MEVLTNSENIYLNNPIFINQIVEENSMKILRDASVLDATYDAGVREFVEDVPPRSTSYDKLVDDLSAWGHQPDTLFSMLCFIGRKSDLALRCAERLDLEGQLAASFFFSKDQVDGPQRFFLTISYQLTKKIPAYRTIVSAKLRHDPDIVHKSLKVQFSDLIALPLESLLSRGQDIGSHNVIVVEGLEECKSDRARHEILRILTSLTGALPFRCVIFSRSQAEIEAQAGKGGLSTYYAGKRDAWKYNWVDDPRMRELFGPE